MFAFVDARKARCYLGTANSDLLYVLNQISAENIRGTGCLRVAS